MIDLSFVIPPGGMGGSAVDVVNNVVVLTTPTGIVRVGLPAGNLISTYEYHLTLCMNIYIYICVCVSVQFVVFELKFFNSYFPLI